jgi:hypothetical protein
MISGLESATPERHEAGLAMGGSFKTHEVSIAFLPDR